VLERRAVQLDMRACRIKDTESEIGRPLKERPQVMSVRLKGSLAVSRQERSRSQLGLIEEPGAHGSSNSQRRQIDNSHHGPPQEVRVPTQQRLAEPAISDTRRQTGERVFWATRVARSVRLARSQSHARAGDRASRQRFGGRASRRSRHGLNHSCARAIGRGTIP
jgi:hypothetical protein